MAQDLIATGRIVQPYTVDGQPHRFVAYVRNIQFSGGNYFINSRTLDDNDTDWEDAAEGLFQALSYLMSGTLTSNADAGLEEKVDEQWNPLAFYTPVTSNAAGSYKVATQSTVVLRDTAFKKMKIIQMETTEAAPQHFTQIAGGDTAYDNYIKQWTSGATVPTPPFSWQVSRGNRYINTAPFVGATVALNRKIRRARGLT